MSIVLPILRLLVLVCLLSATSIVSAQSELDDILSGFEDDPEFEVRDETATSVNPDRDWDISGSAEVSGSFNFRRHTSATGTNYHGLQRLRSRINLQLDADLTDETKLRFESWGFYDSAYEFQDRDQYTGQVLDEYESDGEVGEAWIQSKLTNNVDLKVGRQIVIWGHSENLRVLDVINPIDNREPGRVDLEDLRLPIGMLRADAYFGRWSVTGLVIPELRFNINPVLGSDFFPSTADFRTSEPEHFRDSEFAIALKGTFSGLDVSFHAAEYYDDSAGFRRDSIAAQLVHDRLQLIGIGGAKTVGPWLWKSEVAYLDGLGFFNEADDQSRLDVLLGVEYFGWPNTTLSFEVVNRRLLQYDEAMRNAPDFVRRDSQEVALRFSQDRMNDSLHIVALAIARGWDGKDGSLIRFDVSYDLLDSVALSFGVLIYQDGDLPPFDSYGSNDRVIFSLKWSF